MTINIPATNPSDSPMVGVRFNEDWLRLVLSAVMAYERPYLYDVDDAELKEILTKIEDLTARFTDARPMTISGSPIGMFAHFANIRSEEEGWIWVNGQFILQAEFPELIAVFEAANENNAGIWELGYAGEDYGCYLPEGAESALFGAHPAQGTIRAGNTGGAKTVSLTGEQNGGHTHGISIDGTAGIASSGSSFGAPIFSAGYTASSGLGSPHNNMPPYVGAFLHISCR